MSFKFFRKKAKAAFFVVLVVFTASCSKFLNEKPSKPETIELKNQNFVCLKALPAKVGPYLDGTLPAADIREGIACGQDALTYFKNKTKGSLQEAYTLEDMRNFFGKYFLKQNNVSPEFAAQLFKIKKVILGGDEKYVTKAEIERLVALLAIIKEQAVDLSPRLPALLGRKVDTTWGDIDRSTEQLQAVLSVLLKESDLVRSNYRFTDLKKFFEGLNQFVNGGPAFYVSRNLDRNIGLLEAGKNLILGEDTKFYSLSDWEDALRTILSIYKQSLRYHYFVRNNELQDPQSLNQLMLIIGDFFEAVENSIPMRRQGEISFRAMDNMIDQIVEAGMTPEGVGSTELKDIYKKMTLRLLDPRRHGDARGLVGFRKEHLAVLKLEWKSYRLFQGFIAALPFDKAGGISQADLLKRALAFAAPIYIRNELSTNSLEQEILLEVWNQGVELLRTPFPLVFNPQGQLIIANQSRIPTHTWASLTRWNGMRLLGGELVASYGVRGLTRQGLETWYADFQRLGIQVKAFDERSGNTGTRTFNEANLFSFSGDGNSIVSRREIVEYVSMLLSGGMTTANLIREDLTARGCNLREKDTFDLPWLDEDCFKRSLRERAPVYFANLPGLVDEVKSMTDSQWDVFYQYLMGSARVSARDGKRVETADLRTAVMMLYYTEVLMSVYDRNSNGVLSEDEIRLAAPRFYEFMAAVAPFKFEFGINETFVYLVYFGEKPTVGGAIKYAGQQLSFAGMKDVPRGNILRVFKVLKEEAAAK